MFVQECKGASFAARIGFRDNAARSNPSPEGDPKGEGGERSEPGGGEPEQYRAKAPHPTASLRFGA
jgi:hypothetical protein